jgi:hypothetical protein
MKLKYYTDSEGEKTYTLKEEKPNSKEKTNDAHYKFIKIRDAPPSNTNIVRKN